MTTQQHIVVELEENALGVVVGAIDRGVAHVLHSLRVTLPDASPQALAAALGTIDGEVLAASKQVHLLISDRRLQHFVSTLPPIGSEDAVAFVVREALRLCGVPNTVDVLVATRLLRRLPGGRLQLSTAALARTAFDPVRSAFEAAGIALGSLHAAESLLALAAESPDGRPVAVLECSSGRGRFVLCDGQSPLQVRRFLIGSVSEGNSAALATQLAMELPRTFDWLRETGQPLPRTLLLGSRVAVDDETLEMLRVDELELVERVPLPAVVDEGQPMPTLAALTLLHRLCRGRIPPSLLAPPHLALPWSPRRLLPFAAAALVAGVGAASAVVDFRAAARASDAARVTSQQKQLVAAAVSRLEEAQAPPPPAANDQLAKALVRRRPLSRLLAEISAGAGAAIQIEELKFASTEQLLVVGVVQGSSRRDALTGISAFTQRIARLPYLQPNGQDEVIEIPRQRNCFRFKLGLSWRNS